MWCGVPTSRTVPPWLPGPARWQPPLLGGIGQPGRPAGAVPARRPRSGLGSGAYRRKFDPAAYHVIGFDQRGCGRSTPWSIDALDLLDTNTIQAQIDDIEALREHLGVEKWLLHGISWGSTLALAYALEHPERCSAIVLMAVTS